MVRSEALHQQKREQLMYGTIKAVAENGIEGVTSKKISMASEINEAYIYRYFLDMSDIMQKTFTSVEEKWFKKLREISLNTNIDAEEKYKQIWDFLSENKYQVEFYFRYFFSKEFTGEVAVMHTKRCSEAAYVLPTFDIDASTFNSALLLTLQNIIVAETMPALKGRSPRKQAFRQIESICRT